MSGFNKDFGDMDADSVGYGGDDGLKATGPSGFGAGFGWDDLNTNRPAIVTVATEVWTDGSLPGRIVLEIDFSGGTTGDVNLIMNGIKPDQGILGKTVVSTFGLPPGGSFLIDNNSDPHFQNQVQDGYYFEM